MKTPRPTWADADGYEPCRKHHSILNWQEYERALDIAYECPNCKAWA